MLLLDKQFSDLHFFCCFFFSPPDVCFTALPMPRETKKSMFYTLSSSKLCLDLFHYQQRLLLPFSLWPKPACFTCHKIIFLWPPVIHRGIGFLFLSSTLGVSLAWFAWLPPRKGSRLLPIVPLQVWCVNLVLLFCLCMVAEGEWEERGVLASQSLTADNTKLQLWVLFLKSCPTLQLFSTSWLIWEGKNR